MRAAQYLRAFLGILNREALRWLNQRSRFISALVRPLVWLGIFAAGFRFTLGLSIIEPYDTLCYQMASSGLGGFSLL